MKINAEIQTKINEEIKMPEYLIFLRGVREARGIKQEELGKVLGFSAMAISHFELGRRPINVDLLEKWLDHFGLELRIDFK